MCQYIYVCVCVCVCDVIKRASIDDDNPLKKHTNLYVSRNYFHINYIT